MLFDLKGKRRRAVQGTYLTLAVLMGAGLVLFGVGSSVNGGLGNLFGSNGSGSNNGNQIVQKQIDTANKQLLANPRDAAALKQLVIGHYQLASANSDPNTGAFTKQGQQELAQASTAWQRYLATTANPDPQLATYMFQAYTELGLNQPAKAEQAAEIVASAQPTAVAYIRIVQYASLAHDSRTVNLATAKALSLTPKAQRATVKQQIAQAKAAGVSSAPSGGTTTTP